MLSLDGLPTSQRTVSRLAGKTVPGWARAARRPRVQACATRTESGLLRTSSLSCGSCPSWFPPEEVRRARPRETSLIPTGSRRQTDGGLGSSGEPRITRNTRKPGALGRMPSPNPEKPTGSSLVPRYFQRNGGPPIHNSLALRGTSGERILRTETSRIEPLNQEGTGLGLRLRVGVGAEILPSAFSILPLGFMGRERERESWLSGWWQGIELGTHLAFQGSVDTHSKQREPEIVPPSFCILARRRDLRGKPGFRFTE